MKAGPYSRLGVPGHSLPAVSSGGLLRALAVASSGDLCPKKVIPCVSVSRQKKGLFLTILILYSVANAAELLPMVVGATLVAYSTAKGGQRSIELKL